VYYGNPRLQGHPRSPTGVSSFSSSAVHLPAQSRFGQIVGARGATDTKRNGQTSISCGCCNRLDSAAFWPSLIDSLLTLRIIIITIINTTSELRNVSVTVTVTVTEVGVVDTRYGVSQPGADAER